MIRRNFLKLFGLVPIAPVVAGKVLADAVEPSVRTAILRSCAVDENATQWIEPKNFTKMTVWTGNGKKGSFVDPANWSRVPRGGDILTFQF